MKMLSRNSSSPIKLLKQSKLSSIARDWWLMALCLIVHRLVLWTLF